MYFDPRLWQLTRGLRGWIALAVLLGLVASVVGIARFAILGVLLSRVFNGAGFVTIAIPALGVAAAVALRGIVDHHRAMISHRTAARVQEDLRGRLYDKIAALGPVAIFVFIAFWDVPVATVMLIFALVTLIAPTVFLHVERRSSHGRQ